MKWQDDRLAWAAFAVGAAATGLGGAPSLNWLDSGELVAAARELGMVHPPGHPAWLSLAGLAELLPLGPYALRIAWLSALAAGASLWLLVRLARELGLTEGWAAVAAAALLGSGSLWLVAVRPEVYTLALAGNLWALDAALRAGRQRTFGPLAEGVAATCLGLCNHHYVTIFVTPAVLVAAWPALVTHRRRLGWLVLGAAMLGLTYLALPLRTLADTEMRWGNPATLQGFWDTVTARHFQRSVTDAKVALLLNIAIVLGMIAWQMGWLLAVLGVLGLAVTLVRRDRGRVALAVALVGALLGKALMRVDTRNPDDHGYILMAPAILALTFADLGHLLTRGHARLVRLVPVLVLLPIALGTVATSLDHRLGGLHAPDVVDAHLRHQLPPGALWLSNYYGLQFTEQAFRIAEGRRPDVVASHLSFRTGDTDGGHAYQAWFAKRHPQMRELAVAAQGLGKAPIGHVLALVERQPVLMEPDPEARVPAAYLGPGAIAHRLLRQDERAIDYDLAAWRKRQTETWQALRAQLSTVDLVDDPTRSVLLWQHALEAAHALRRGWFLLAGDELQAARRLNARDRLLAVLTQKQAALAAA